MAQEWRETDGLERALEGGASSNWLLSGDRRCGAGLVVVKDAFQASGLVHGAAILLGINSKQDRRTRWA